MKKKPVAKTTKKPAAKSPTRTQGKIVMSLTPPAPTPDEISSFFNELQNKNHGPRSLLSISTDVEDLAYEILGPREALYIMVDGLYVNDNSSYVVGMLERELTRLHERFLEISEELRKHNSY